MGELKLEVRRQAAHEIGIKIEDRLEAARLEAARAEGAGQMALQLQRQVEALHAHVDKSIAAEEFETLAVAQHIKDWITRASAVCGSGAQSASNNALVARGKLQALEDAVKLVAGVHQDATKRLALLQQASAEDDGPPAGDPGAAARIVGEHPRESVRVRRAREEQQLTSAGEPGVAEVGPGAGETSTPEAADATDTG